MGNYTQPFSQRISGGSSSGGSGGGSGIDVRSNGALVVAGATTLDISGAVVAGAGTTAAIAVVPTAPNLENSVSEHTFIPTPGQLVFVLPFDVQDIVEVHINGLGADFTFAHPRTITLHIPNYTLAPTDRVMVAYFP